MDEYLTTAQVSKLTGIKEETLRRHRCDRRGIPFYKLAGTVVRYRRSDVEAFIESSRVETAEAS